MWLDLCASGNQPPPEERISYFDPRFHGEDGKPDPEKVAAFIKEQEERQGLRDEGLLSPDDARLINLASSIITEAQIAQASNYLAFPDGVPYNQVDAWKWELYCKFWDGKDEGSAK